MAKDLSRPGIEHEPALAAGAAPSEQAATPRDALGEEPALASVAGLTTYAASYSARRTETPPWRRWVAVSAAALIAGSLGVFGAFASLFYTGATGAVLAVVVFGPLVEETAKSFAAWYLAEQRPWLVPTASSLIFVMVAGGIGFAIIENWLYLNVYIDDPSAGLIRWRWIFGPLVHGIGSLIVGIGLSRSWRGLDRNGAAPRPDSIVPWLIGAAVFHGGYNLLALLLETTGRLPI